VIGWFFYDFYKPTAQTQSSPLIVNDITGLNPVNVAFNIRPTTQQQIVDAVLSTNGPISIGGARYSMGGQIAYPESLHLDMRDYDEVIELDTENKLITVQPGITWKQVQQLIDPHNLSVKVMQDFNNFTVGGSLSVNAHGRFMGTGPIINTVRSIKIVLANGQVHEASPSHNPSLFRGAIGGYGGLGVISEVTLELADNVPIERSSKMMNFNEYLYYFNDNILHDDSVVLHNAFLYPPNYETLRDNTWRLTDKPLTNEQRLREFNPDNWWKPAVIDLIARSNLLKRVRKNLIDPLVHDKPAVVMRNLETSYDLHEFGFAARSGSTLALREYFVPVQNFEIFVLKLRDVFIRNQVNVLNISVRHTPTDSTSLLAWAKEDVFSFVVSYQQNKDPESIKHVDLWSNELNQAAIESGGSYYMPFQIQDSLEQFYRAYPGADYFFELKRWSDPQNRFNNLLWLAFYPENSSAKAAWIKSRSKPEIKEEEINNANTSYNVEGREPAKINSVLQRSTGHEFVEAKGISGG
jgi:FAD/FMN-containing dehydrogenase